VTLRAPLLSVQAADFDGGAKRKADASRRFPGDGRNQSEMELEQ